MTLPEIEAEIARLTDEVSRLTTLRDDMADAQLLLDIEQALVDPEIRAAFAQTIAHMDRETGRGPRSPETLDWLARNNPFATAALLLIYRDTTRSPA